MFYFLIVISIILLIIGLIGCILPALPGPPIAFLSLVILQLIKEPPPFAITFLGIFAGLNIVLLVLDYILPVLGAKLYGASKYGIWGAIIGMIVGSIFFPPFGMIPGILIGAIMGEYVAGKKDAEAFKSGFASFVFSVIVILLKFSLWGATVFYFFKNAF
ncbi:DUF456 domain-containing protein [Spirochaetota bacterium]